mmetsp:Transcript_887/g.2466  ORF Transcript_887/g.2466 Transcript_887/m.2466 type:complete len:167 (+) Transcript_887:77-577(+)
MGCFGGRLADTGEGDRPQQCQKKALTVHHDGAPAELKSRELPIIPETGFQDDRLSDASSRVASVTTIGTPKSIPVSHLDSVANSLIRAENDRESQDGRSVGMVSTGMVSTTGTFARPIEDESSNRSFRSLVESRLDSQNYLSDLDRMVVDDGLGAKRADVNKKVRI